MQTERKQLMTDYTLFDFSIGLFAERMKKVLIDKDNIVVALSRKGPRLLESLFKHEELSGNVISEHALPFLFNKLLVNPQFNCNLYIVDDAIYYGSTVNALIDEIQEYIRLLKLEQRVRIEGIIAVIKDPNSMDIMVEGHKPLANDEVRSGYGHYFVKKVMERIRSVGNPLEIEFPVVKYQIKENVGIKDIYACLKQNFRSGSVGMVSAKDGIESVSVILSEFDDTTLRKLRIYIKEGELLISVISPELVPSDFAQLKYAAFGSSQSRLTYLWRGLYSNLHFFYNAIKKKDGHTRNIERSAVILLNFLSSVDTYCYEKWKIEDSLSDYIGLHPVAYIDDTNVGYLTDIRLSERVTDEVNKFLNSNEQSPYPMNLRVDTSEDIVRESVSMTDSEKSALVKANMTGVYQSKTVEEALSVMMFNQMVMIEKMSRFRSNLVNSGRLLFGYSFFSIVDFLRRFASGLRGEDIAGERVHERIDSQIDNSCIVPQYIIDANNNHWTRVFRPGENEDILLSHLGRFVAFVMNNMYRNDDERSDGHVLKANLNGILTYVYQKNRDELINQEPSFDFNVHERHYLYSNDKSESVVDFLVRMSVLSIDDNQRVSINSRIQRMEFSENTTLTDELSEKISEGVKQIVNRLPQNKPQSAYLYPNTINYFLLDYADKTMMADAVNEVGSLAIEKIDEIVLSIKKGGYNGEIALANVTRLAHYYMKKLSQYELKTSDMNGKKVLTHPLNDMVQKVRRVLFAINLLIIIVKKHTSLKEYINRPSVLDIKQILRCNEVIEAVENSNDNFVPDVTLLNIIKQYIKTNILA